MVFLASCEINCKGRIFFLNNVIKNLFCVMFALIMTNISKNNAVFIALEVVIFTPRPSHRTWRRDSLSC